MLPGLLKANAVGPVVWFEPVPKPWLAEPSIECVR